MKLMDMYNLYIYLFIYCLLMLLMFVSITDVCMHY